MTMKLNIPLQFTGVVTVAVPNHLSSNDAKLLATKIAVARLVATTDNPDAPKDDALSEYGEECSDSARSTAEEDWDKCRALVSSNQRSMSARSGKKVGREIQR